MSLFIHPHERRRLTPQLSETAAWVAGMSSDVFHQVVQIDPEVLLRSDLAAVGEADRVTLVNFLLGYFQQEGARERDYRRFYAKLAHSTLADQLRPYIIDSTKGILVRRVAVNIAESCQLANLQEELLQVVLDPNENYQIRAHAAYAILNIGNGNTQQRLKPLVFGQLGLDPYDELKGCALLALWPEQISFQELLPELTPPKMSSFVGFYRRFIFEFPKRLSVSDLPFALEWVAHQEFNEHWHDMNLAGDQVMQIAWLNLDKPGILQAFAKAAMSRLHASQELVREDFPFSLNTESEASFGKLFRQEVEKRRQVVLAALELLPDQEHVYYLSYTRTPLLDGGDLYWLVEQYCAAGRLETKRILAQLAWMLFNQRAPDQVELIFLTLHEEEEVQNWFQRFFGPIGLNSSEAKEMKIDYERKQRRKVREEQSKIPVALFKQRVEEFLYAFEHGDLDGWWRLNILLTGEPDRTEYNPMLAFHADLTLLPGWAALTTMDVDRILAASQRYVLEADPETSEWFGTDQYYESALAGYRALLLLCRNKSDVLEDIPQAVWQKWTPTIMSYPLNYSRQNKPDYCLAELAYHFAPEQVIESLMILIDRQENSQLDFLYGLERIEGCWDERLSDALLPKAKEARKPNRLIAFLRCLLKHQSQKARQFAEELVNTLSTGDENQTRALIAAQSLAEYADDAGWSVIWPAMKSHIEFGRELVSRFVHDLNYERFPFGRLTTNQLADLFVWLAQQYPHGEDPRFDGIHRITTREEIARLREAILNQLRNRADPDAIDALGRIYEEFPALPHVRWVAEDAITDYLKTIWSPLRPEEFMMLSRNQDKRPVRSGEELMEVVWEALERLEKKLHDETPAVFDLWNEVKVKGKRKPKFEPKDENRLSDYVKRYLDADVRDRGIIVNREVEIRRGVGQVSGQRTDVHVDAVMRDRQGRLDTLKAIIEVKGSWNDEIDSAMETQLRDRYLHENKCNHGLYLIGWFECQNWNSGHAHIRGLDIAQARAKYEQQASTLSSSNAKLRAFVLDTALR